MASPWKLLHLGLILVFLSFFHTSLAAEPTGDRRAPVDNAGRIVDKNHHVVPAGVEEPQPDWTMLKAWDNGRSGLSQIGHSIHPAGESLRVPGRVLGIAVAQGGKYLVAKTDACLAVVDIATFKSVKQFRYPEVSRRQNDQGSMHGLAVSLDGTTVYVTGNTRNLYVAALDPQGGLKIGPAIDLSANGGSVNPLGVALSADGKLALVALSVANELAVVDLPACRVLGRIPVGVCPYGVVWTPDGKTALVSNFGGGRAARAIGRKSRLARTLPSMNEVWHYVAACR